MAVSYFDSLFIVADPVLDEVFAKTFYYRHDGQSIEITASLRAHDIEANEENGLIESWHGHDFELRTDALTLDGVFFRPQAGDEIAEPIDAGGYSVYQVLPPPKKRCYEPVDAEETKLLVFAKFVREESA